MKAAVTTGEKREIVIKDFPMPEVKPGTLLLKVRCCGICGSDLEYVDGALEEYLGPDLKLIAGATPGHHFCADVAEIGEGVEGWSIGDRVTGGGAFQSVRGQPSAAQPHMYYWEKQGPGNPWGAFAEYFVRPANSVQKVPDSVSDELVTLHELIAVGMSGIISAGLKMGDSLVVYGTGRIGLGTIACAKASGIAPVVGIDLVKSRLDKALEMGADAALNPKEVDVVSEVAKLIEGGPNAVIICAREGRVLQQAVDIVKRGGIVVLTAWAAPEEINPTKMSTKQATITAKGARPSAEISMDILVQGRVNLKPITPVFMPLEDIQKGFDSMYSGENIHVILKP